MKKISLIVSMLCIVFTSNAQYYYNAYANAGANPGTLNADPEYPVGGGIATGWTTIQGTAATPVWSTVQTLPFAFSFNGGAVTQYKVSTSGVLTFDVATALVAPSYTKAALPDATIPNSSVCIWGLAALGANDNIVSKTFGVAPNRQHWIQFSSYGYGTTVSDGSNFTYWSIVLDETTNSIHIVDNRTGGYATTKSVSAGIQINATTAVSIATSPNLLSLAATDPTPADNSYYTFMQGVQPNYDMHMVSISTPSYVVTGNNNITGIIQNFGAVPVTSFTINYKIDGGAVVSAPVTAVNVTSNGTYTFTHATPWSATVGTHTCECYATNINGNPDANTANDATMKTINVLSEIVQRIPLFEIFTSSTCGPCAPGNTNYHSIVDLKSADDFVSIKFQQDFPGTGDPYCTTEGFNRRNFYAINSIPRMEIDGGWDGNASSFTTALYDEARAVPAQFKMQGSFLNVPSTKTLSGKVKYAPLFNNTASNSKLYIAIIENLTTANVKSNGETKFEQVMKKMIPSDVGAALPAHNAGIWDSTTFTYTFNGNYRLPADGQAANRINHTTEHSVENFGNLRIVAWIQSTAADKQVFQAINLTGSFPTGIKEDVSVSIKNVEMYPNPTTTSLNVTMDMKSADDIMIYIVNTQGEMVKAITKKVQSGTNKIALDMSTLASGSYYITVLDSKNNSSTHQISVIR